MRRTSLSLLMLALLVGACGDDDGGPRLATIDELRVVKVAGDQTTQVPDGVPVATIYATAGAALQATPGEDWTPEPLVARVEATVQSRGTGPSAVIPPGTLVHWQIPEVAGRLFAGTTATDDSAHVINRYAPGTKAGTYIAYAGRMIGSEIVVDAEWELVVLPGPVASVQWALNMHRDYLAGDTIDISSAITGGHDAHGNAVALEDIVAGTPAGSAWAPIGETSGGICRNYPSTPQQAGWASIVPTEAAGWPHIAYENYNACLWIWVDGVVSEYPVRVSQ